MDALKELLKCKNVKPLGLWKDPEGKYPPIPVFELTDPTADEWNARARELDQRRENGKRG